LTSLAIPLRCSQPITFFSSHDIKKLLDFFVDKLRHQNSNPNPPIIEWNRDLSPRMLIENLEGPGVCMFVLLISLSY